MIQPVDCYNVECDTVFCICFGFIYEIWCLDFDGLPFGWYQFGLDIILVKPVCVFVVMLSDESPYISVFVLIVMFGSSVCSISCL